MTEQTEEATEEVETPEEETTEEEPETFPRTYVERLRREAAEHRTRAQRADDLAGRLHTALVTATGRLADPTDLAFDEEPPGGRGSAHDRDGRPAGTQAAPGIA